MWDLASGRKAFLGIHRGMPNRSFWYYLLKDHGQKSLLEAPELQDALNWVPNLSNCPELDLEISKLLEDVPLSWKDFLGSIFVGRSMGGAVNAGSKQRRGQAWVGISFQYTSAVSAYISAYDRWTDAFARHERGESDDGARIKEVFSGIAMSRSSWADEKSFVGTHATLLAGPHGRGPQDYGPLVLDAEMFIIGHEYGHHLLGHTNTRAKSFGLTEHLRAQLTAAGLHRFVFLRSDSQTQEPVTSKGDQNPLVSQTDELLADVVGLTLAATSRERNRTGAVYRAMIGATCALLAEADIKHHWFLQKNDKYPSTSDRITLLLNLMPKLFQDYTPLGDHDSVEQLARQLASFATACLQSSLHDKEPGRYPAPTWKQILAAYMEAGLAMRTMKDNVGAMKLGGSWQIAEAN